MVCSLDVVCDDLEVEDADNGFPAEVRYVCFIGTVVGTSRGDWLIADGSPLGDDDSSPTCSTSTAILGERVGLM